VRPTAESKERRLPNWPALAVVPDRAYFYAISTRLRATAPQFYRRPMKTRRDRLPELLTPPPAPPGPAPRPRPRPRHHARFIYVPDPTSRKLGWRGGAEERLRGLSNAGRATTDRSDPPNRPIDRLLINPNNPGARLDQLIAKAETIRFVRVSLTSTPVRAPPAATLIRDPSLSLWLSGHVDGHRSPADDYGEHESAVLLWASFSEALYPARKPGSSPYAHSSPPPHALPYKKAATFVYMCKCTCV
jgi:hypothetical protein